jgi:isopenicillin-N epimerase
MVEGCYVGWDRIDECFSLDPARAYLNHGTSGAVPVPVQRAQQRLRGEMEANPQRFFTRGLTDRIEHTRRYLAGFLGADPDRTALTVNVTAGIAVVLGSVPGRPDDEIVVTDHGYGAVRLAAVAAGARLRVVPVDLAATDEQIVGAVLGAVDPARTRLVVLDLISAATARRMPVEAVAAALAEAGRPTGGSVPLLVDAAHAPGMLPLSVDALGADFVAGTLHKWAFAPRGTAVLAVADRWRAAIRPRVVSWAEPDGFPRSLEWLGTADYTGWLAAPAGLFTLRTLDVDRVRRHNAELAGYGQRAVGAALGLAPAELPDPRGPVAMRVVPLPARLPGTAEAAIRLRDRISDELATEVSVMAWRDRLLLRLAAQVYNRPEQYDRLAERLPALLARA